MCVVAYGSLGFRLFFFFNDTATTEIYTLSLHDALPICGPPGARAPDRRVGAPAGGSGARALAGHAGRSEEHTSELQSQSKLVCRLLLEKKKNSHNNTLYRHTRRCKVTST